MRVKTIVSALVAGCAVVLMSGGPDLAAQTYPKPEPAPAAQAKPDAGLEARCQAMMAQHDKVMSEVKAADARLDTLVASMNAAAGPAKVDATAAVVTELVTQRKTMRERMMMMQQAMMGHMAEHMQAGAGSMAACPMMKGMHEMQKK